MTENLKIVVSMVDVEGGEIQLPTFQEINGVSEAINGVENKIREEVETKLSNSNNGLESRIDEKLVLKADLVNGRVPASQSPAFKDVEGAKGALDGLKEALTTKYDQKVVELSEGKADLVDGKIPTSQLPIDGIVTPLEFQLKSQELDTKFSNLEDSVEAEKNAFITQAGNLIARKANAVDVYDKVNIDNKLDGKVDEAVYAGEIVKKADQTYVDAVIGAISTDASKQYATLALAISDIANIAINKNVFVGEAANIGYWYKTTAGATSLTKSPYDPLEQAKSLAARSELLKQYVALPYESKTSGYALNERVQLATGDIVRSTIPSNVNNPNVNMTGWEVPSLKPADNLSDVPNKAAARSNLSVYSKAQVDTAIALATPTIPDATVEAKGIVRLANSSDISNNSKTVAVSPKDVNAMLSGQVVLKADLVNGRVPASQSPAFKDVEGAKGALDGLKEALTTKYDQKVVELSEGKADLVDGKIPTSQLPIDGITLPLATTSVSGTVQLNNTLTSTSTGQALTAAQGKALNDSKLAKTENAVSASKLETSRTISLSGGVTGSVSFDGSANASIATSITGLGVANGIATLDSNGQVPSTQLPSFVDDVLEYAKLAAFPTTGETGKIYVETTGNATYRWGGTGYVKITSGEVSSVAGKTGIVTLTKSDVGLANADNTADSVKNVASSSMLTVARTIGGVPFNGTANINLPGVNTTGNQSTTGNASTATTLQTARTINGTSFNGSANITTTNWGTARTLTLGGTGKSVNGSADVSWSADEILPTGTNGQVLKHNGTSWIAGTDVDTLYIVMSAEEATTGTATTARLITPAILKSTITALAPVQTSITGNAASATKLATPVQIHGVNFDGSIGFVIPNFTASKSGVVPAAGADTTKYLRSDGTWQVPTNTAYTTITSAEVNAGTDTTSKLVTAALLKQAVTKHTPLVTNIIGNAVTATKLATARKINGIGFDGTGDINLDVYSRAQVDTAIANATPTTRNATEVVTGVAKIATTAIAQAGTNDTDILTAKKLRDALNASGNAPVSACRAWVCFNGTATPPEIRSSLNISSVVKNATGDYTLNFTTPLENSNYAVSCGGAMGLLGSKYYPCVKARESGGEPMLKTPTQLGIACIATSTSTSLNDMSEIYVEVFC